MKHAKFIVLLMGLSLVFTSCQINEASKGKWSFYGDKLMPDESLLFSSDVDSRFGRLLFKPTKVLSLKAADESITYEEGKDYTVDYEKSLIKLTDNSRIPCSQLYGGTGKNYGRFKNRKGQKMLFSEADFFHKLQVKVAYEHNGQGWDDKTFVPANKVSEFPQLHNALKTKEKFTLALIGDSISVGYNASAFVKAAPYLPAFGPQVADALKKKFKRDVTFFNQSRAGGGAGWGVGNVPKVLAQNPDLVMIAFGMNDGRRPGGEQRYEDNIRKMILALRKSQPKLPIVLVANMLPNEEFSQHKGHFANRDRLLKLEKEFANLAVADVMSVTAAMLKVKKFADICGNHVNHPNDFIHRLYASVILRTVGM
jgi:lysophospholipase L1-like esterase